MHIKILFLIALLLFNTAQVTANAPAINSWTTENGARVYFVSAPELPMIDVRIVFDAGGAKDGKLAGLALLTNGLLAEGAKNLDATQIAKRFENLGARFSASSHRDMAVMSLRSLSDPELLTPALETLGLIMSQPSFPKESLERERKRLLISLQSEKESPGEIGSRAFFAAVYKQHPYAQLPQGTETSVKAITRRDITRHHADYYVASNATIAVVGNVSQQQVQTLTNKLMALLPKGKPAKPVQAVPELSAAEYLPIQYPSKQSHIMVGQPGMRRNDPDYFPLYVGNHVLGGSGLVSRLSEKIREDRGLAYSAYSYFSPMRAEGPFILGLQTKNDQAEEALTILKKTLKEFINKGPEEQELIAAKQNITGSFPLKIASNSSIVEYLSLIAFYQLPMDYLDTFNDKVNAVTIKQIIDAFKRRVQPDKMITIVVGDTSTGS
ncbi:MAG: insulinase family protein [Gammaproteobacteria bacterium]|nr:insulinase family protein [Gammaproteobacteria bacterium]